MLTRHSRRQSTLSRIFTGTTLFIRSEHFTSDMTILPASKKKVRLRCARGWVCTPSAVMAPRQPYELLAPDGGKTTIEFN